jgi:hypothetical protein
VAPENLRKKKKNHCEKNNEKNKKTKKQKMAGTILKKRSVILVVALALLAHSRVGSAQFSRDAEFLDGFCTDTAASVKTATAEENCRAGAVPPSEWDVNGAGHPSVQGFAMQTSYLAGATVALKVSTAARVPADATARADIYRLGYYGGPGARRLASVPINMTLSSTQPACATHNEPVFGGGATSIPAFGEERVECSRWRVAANWTVPRDAVSGVYIARLVLTGAPAGTWRADASSIDEDPMFADPSDGPARPAGPEPSAGALGANGFGRLRNALREPVASHVYFVVRPTDEELADKHRFDLVVQTMDATWVAYNPYGGRTAYSNPRCRRCSYDRPLATRSFRAINSPFGAEYPAWRFLEAHGFNIAYVASTDVATAAAANTWAPRVFASVGHDEYWSGAQRDSVVAMRDRGVHLVFLSGNEMYWRVRHEDGGRTVAVFKDSQGSVKHDPVADDWTGTFRDARAINPLGGAPENAVTGTLFAVNAWRAEPLVVPPRFARLRQWRGTAVAKLKRGDPPFVSVKGILGHEWDADIDNGARPRGLVHLSETGPVDNVLVIQDTGRTFDSGSATHNLVLHRAGPSDALVFGAGTPQLSWGLDPCHDDVNSVPAHVANVFNTRVGVDIAGGDPTIRFV